MSVTSPRLRVREALAALAAGILLAALSFWPLPLDLGSHVVKELADPLLQAWQVAWGGHALSAQPLDYFQANTFWPLEDSLAFSDALIGYAPAGLIGDGVGAAIARYNLLFLFAYGLAFAGAYLLSRELGAWPAAAAVAGAAFAFAPWRLEQTSHLHVLSSGGIPLALFLLLRGHRRRSVPLVVAGWLAAAWQLSLGFTLGLQLAYLLLTLGLAAAVGWLLAGRPRVDRRLAAATAGGAAAFAAVGILLAQPYLEVADRHSEARRTLEEIALLSPPPRSFLAAPDASPVWGRATEGIREDLPWGPEPSTTMPRARARTAAAATRAPARLRSAACSASAPPAASSASPSEVRGLIRPGVRMPSQPGASS